MMMSTDLTANAHLGILATVVSMKLTNANQILVNMAVLVVMLLMLILVYVQLDTLDGTVNRTLMTA